MHQLKVIATVISVVILIAVFWVVKNSLVEEVSNVSVAVSRTPLSAPIYIADSLGYFTAAGLNVELIEVNGGNLTFQSMMDGAADFATSSDSVIMINGFKHNDFENLATFVHSAHDVKVLTKASLAIRSAKDLKGKKVAIIKGSASEYFLDVFLALEGVEFSNVILVDLPANEMSLALEQNQVDAIVVWEPFAYESTKNIGNEAVLLSSSNLYELTFNLLAKKQTTANDPKTTIKVITALKQAVEYINANEAKAQDLLKMRLGLDQQFIEWIWGDYRYDVALNRSLILTLENEARWAISRGLTDKKVIPEYRKFMNPEPLMTVSPYSVSL
ncbi:MAG: sulfonate transport system substrate-binding protein [Pseudohongiellaceae bacterium]|jgi:sulfonate transport system substrate-binding protein